MALSSGRSVSPVGCVSVGGSFFAGAGLAARAGAAASRRARIGTKRQRTACMGIRAPRSGGEKGRQTATELSQGASGRQAGGGGDDPVQTLAQTSLCVQVSTRPPTNPGRSPTSPAAPSAPPPQGWPRRRCPRRCLRRAVVSFQPAVIWRRFAVVSIRRPVAGYGSAASLRRLSQQNPVRRVLYYGEARCC